MISRISDRLHWKVTCLLPILLRRWLSFSRIGVVYHSSLRNNISLQQPAYRNTHSINLHGGSFVPASRPKTSRADCHRKSSSSVPRPLGFVCSSGVEATGGPELTLNEGRYWLFTPEEGSLHKTHHFVKVTRFRTWMFFCCWFEKFSISFNQAFLLFKEHLVESVDSLHERSHCFLVRVFTHIVCFLWMLVLGELCRKIMLLYSL